MTLTIVSTQELKVYNSPHIHTSQWCGMGTIRTYMTMRMKLPIDINPIEHLWVDLKKAHKKFLTPHKRVHELWESVVEE